jgi:hypothetical protein
MADILVSKRLHSSNLQLIEQTVGGYHCVKPIRADSIAYHYDSLGYAGTLYHLKQHHSSLYKQYRMFFEEILNVPINNQQEYWEQIRDRYYECH